MPSASAQQAATSIQLRQVPAGRWHELASEFADYGFQQTAGYAERMAERFNGTAEHQAVVRGNETVGLASVRVKDVPVVGGGIAYVPGGPLWRLTGQEPSTRRLDIALDALRHEYVNRRGLLLRVAPLPVPDSLRAEIDRCFEAHGFARSSEPQRRTILLDTGQPEEAIRSGFKHKWRYNLKKAEGKGLSLEHGQSTELFERFRPLFNEFVVWKGFEVDLGADFFGALQEELPPEARLHVFLASEGEELAAGAVASVLGDTAVYVLGASSDVGRRTYASYLLHWKAIETARAGGCRHYDLGGIDPEGNPGVYRFKRQMGGVEARTPGPYEATPGRLRGALTNRLERGYRALRKRPASLSRA